MALGQIPASNPVYKFVFSARVAGTDTGAIPVSVTLTPGVYKIYQTVANYNTQTTATTRTLQYPYSITWNSGSSNHTSRYTVSDSTTYNNIQPESTFYISTTKTVLYFDFPKFYESFLGTAANYQNTNNSPGIFYLDGKLWSPKSDFRVSYSTDGITWSQSNQYGTTLMNAFVFGTGETEKYVIYQNNTAVNDYYTSTDGVTWTTRTLPVAGSIVNRIIYAAGSYYMIIRNTTSLESRIYSSADGITWTQRYSNGVAGNYINSIAYGAAEARQFVATADNQLATSTDGVTWGNALTSSGYGIPCFVFYDGGIYYVYFSSSIIAQSTDGVTWTTTVGPTGVIYWATKLDATNYIINNSGGPYVSTVPNPTTTTTLPRLPSDVDASTGLVFNQQSIAYINQTGYKYFASGNNATDLLKSEYIHGYSTLLETKPVTIERIGGGSVTVIV